MFDEEIIRIACWDRIVVVIYFNHSLLSATRRIIIYDLLRFCFQVFDFNLSSSSSFEMSSNARAQLNFHISLSRRNEDAVWVRWNGAIGVWFSDDWQLLMRSSTERVQNKIQTVVSPVHKCTSSPTESLTIFSPSFCFLNFHKMVRVFLCFELTLARFERFAIECTLVECSKKRFKGCHFQSNATNRNGYHFNLMLFFLLFSLLFSLFFHFRFFFAARPELLFCENKRAWNGEMSPSDGDMQNTTK